VLSSFDDRFKVAPIAIVPSKQGWEVVTSNRYLIAEPEIAKQKSSGGTAGNLQPSAGLSRSFLSRVHWSVS
jgi:hypothetical protein